MNVITHYWQHCVISITLFFYIFFVYFGVLFDGAQGLFLARCSRVIPVVPREPDSWGWGFELGSAECKSGAFTPVLTFWHKSCFSKENFSKKNYRVFQCRQFHIDTKVAVMLIAPLLSLMGSVLHSNKMLEDRNSSGHSSSSARRKKSPWKSKRKNNSQSTAQISCRLDKLQSYCTNPISFLISQIKILRNFQRRIQLRFISFYPNGSRKYI